MEPTLQPDSNDDPFLEPAYHYIESVLNHSFNTDSGPLAAHLTFNYGPHACSVGQFSLSIRRASREVSGPLPVTQSAAAAAVESFMAPYDPSPNAVSTVRDAITSFTPDPDAVPLWVSRDEIPHPAAVDDPHRTVDPMVLIGHPNLERRDNGTVGAYRLLGADTDGVAVHRPSWKHSDVDRSMYPYAVTGDGEDYTPVSGISLHTPDKEVPYEHTSTVGGIPHFFPGATVTIDDDCAIINLDTSVPVWGRDLQL